MKYQIRHVTMREMMGSVDLCISAGGGTLYECLAMGLPVIGFIMADNQQLGVDTLYEQGYIFKWQVEVSEASIQAFQSIWERVKHQAVRQSLADRGRLLIDGQGSTRVSQYLIEVMNNGKK